MKKDPPAWRGSYPHPTCKPTLTVLWTPLASASPLQLRVEQGRPPWGKRPRAACTVLSERVPMGTHSRWGAPHARLWVWSPQGWWRCGRREALTSSVNGLRACRCPQAGLPGGCSKEAAATPGPSEAWVDGWAGWRDGRFKACGHGVQVRGADRSWRGDWQPRASEGAGRTAEPCRPLALSWGPREGPTQGAGSAWWTC